MASGGARNRSGPPPNPNSGRSDRRSYSLRPLPAAGYAGPIPGFPLSSVSPREQDLWNEVWRSPQACAWALKSEQWRIRTVAFWVRLSIRCELPDAGAALYAQMNRFADQIGMTTAGLAEMGYTVQIDELEAKRAASPRKPKSSRDRIKVAAGDVG